VADEITLTGEASLILREDEVLAIIETIYRRT
jgi:hypothetical protein